MNSWGATDNVVLEFLGCSCVGIVSRFNISCLGSLKSLLLGYDICSGLSLYLVTFVRFVVIFLGKGEVDSSNNFAVFLLSLTFINMEGAVELVPRGIMGGLFFFKTILLINKFISS